MKFRIFPNSARLKEFALIGFIAAMLTSFMTWPLVTKLGSFSSDGGDFTVNAWMMWYNQFALTTGRIFHQQIYFNGLAHFPMPYSLAYYDNSVVPSLLFFAPIYWATHHYIFSVNCFALLTFVLTFLAGYYVIKYFVKQTAASLIGAAIYTFNPLVFSHFPEFLDLMNRYFLPLVLLFAYQYFKTPNFKNALLFFLFFTLNGLSAVYFECFSIVLTPLVVLPIFSIRLFRHGLSYLLDLAKTGLVFFIFLPVLLYFNLPYLEFSKKEGVIRTLENNVTGSARLIDWVCSTPDSFVYGKWADRIHALSTPAGLGSNFNDHVLFLNVLPCFLVVLGLLCLCMRVRNQEEKPASLGLALLAIASLILAFGPFYLGWNGTVCGMKLPFYYLRMYSPLLDGTREPLRFQYMFYVPFSIFASYGAARLLPKDGWRRRMTTLLLLSLFVLENFNIRSYDKTSYLLHYLSNDAHRANLTFLEGKVTLHIPIYSRSFESKYYNWDALTKETMMNGYAGSYMPLDVFDFLVHLTDHLNLPKPALEKLNALGVDYIIIHKDLMRMDFPSAYEHDFSRFYDLYKQGKCFEDDELLVMDLKKYGFADRKCNLPNDFEAQLTLPVPVFSSEPLYYQLTLKNKANCYLCSEFNDRYLPSILSVDGKKVISTIKMPVLIEPFEERSLLAHAGRVGNRPIFLKPGRHQVDIDVEKLQLQRHFEFEIPSVETSRR